MMIFPMPEQIKMLREQLCESAAEASRAVLTARQIWESWEKPVGSPGHLPMPLAAWDLYLFHCSVKGVEVPAGFANFPGLRLKGRSFQELDGSNSPNENDQVQYA